MAVACTVLLPSLVAQQSPVPHRIGRTAAAQKAITAAAPLPTARLDMLTRLQNEALGSGDPEHIAAASRELNAELLSLLGTIAAGEGRTEEAVSLDHASLALHSDAAVQLNLAVLLSNSGHTDEGVALAQQVATADPQNVRALTALAAMLRSAHRDKQAIEPLSRALQLDPQPSIAFALGSAMLASGDKVEADKVFKRLLQASDGAPIWLVAVGDAYRENDYLQDAANEFRKAIAIDPRATHAEFFLGLVELQMNEWGPNSESFTHLRKSVEQNPHEYLSNFYLGALESTDGSDLAASDRHLQAAAAADPSQPEVWIYMGQNANREHRSAEAIADFRKAIQLTGGNEARNHYQVRRAYFALGRLLVMQGQREEGEKYLADFKRTAAEAAAQASQTVVSKQGAAAPGSIDQKPSETAGDTASLRSLAADTAPAQIAAPENALGTTATNPAVSPQLRSAEAQLRALLGTSYNDLGTAEARQQQYAQALQDFEQAQRFGNATPTVLHNTAVAALRMQDSTGVAQALNAYFDTTPTPNDPRARLMLAMADFDLGRFSEAARAFGAAGDLTNADPRTLYSDAYALARSGDAQQATALADKLSAMNLPPDRQMLVCNVYFTAENYEGSRACYTRVTQAAPDLPRAHFFVGDSLVHLDRPAEAIPELQAEQKLSPDEPNVNSTLAFALAQTGHKDEALTMLQSTVAAHPRAAEAQYQLGKLLAEQGKTAEAIPHLEASVASDASKDYAHYQLATAYRKAGRTADADREFQAYRKIKDQHRNDRAIPQAAAAAGTS